MQQHCSSLLGAAHVQPGTPGCPALHARLPRLLGDETHGRLKGWGTLRLPLCCSAPKKQRLDDFQVVKYPLTTESAMKKIEDNNTLVSCLQAPWLYRYSTSPSPSRSAISKEGSCWLQVYCQLASFVVIVSANTPHRDNPAPQHECLQHHGDMAELKQSCLAVSKRAAAWDASKLPAQMALAM